MLQEQVITADLFFTSFVVEHNLSFASSDYFTKLCKVMFPDSQIAKTSPIAEPRQKLLLPMHQILRSYLTNCIKHEVLFAAVDITTVEYANASELVIGTATHLFLTKNENDVASTQLKKNFFIVVCLFNKKKRVHHP